MSYLHSYKYTDMQQYINKYENMNDVVTNEYTYNCKYV